MIFELEPSLWKYIYYNSLEIEDLLVFLQTCRFINSQKKYIYRLIFQKIIFKFDDCLPKMKNIIILFNNNSILESYLYSSDINRNKIKLFKILYEKIIKNTDVPNQKIQKIINSYTYLENSLDKVTTTCKIVQTNNINIIIDNHFNNKKLKCKG